MGKATNVATPSSAFRESPHKKRPKTIKIRLNPGKIARTVTSRSSHQDEASHTSRQSPLLEPVSSNWHLEYDINRLLGEGAFGKVYEARRIKDSCLVALKIINVDSVTNTALERELNAMRILSNPGHEHICSLYDQYQDNTKFIISMEHISGEELFEHLVSKGSFSEREASNFLCQCAEGLQYIHGKKMIHGDLKPENLMMCSNGNVKIVDFGSCASFFSTPLIFGTIAYLSPEVLRTFGVPQIPRPSVDFWAFGVIMFIMLTGRHPFDATNVASDDVIRQNIINTLSDHDDSIFFNLEGLSMSSINLMKRLLNADPKHRIGVNEFLDDCWCQNAAPKTCLQNCEELREFNAKAKRRFKAAVSTIIAVHKLKSLR